MSQRVVLVALVLILILAGCTISSPQPAAWETSGMNHGFFSTKEIAMRAYSVDGFPEQTTLEVTCFYKHQARMQDYISVRIHAEPFIYRGDNIRAHLVWDDDDADIDDFGTWDAHYMDILDSTNFSPAFSFGAGDDEVVRRLHRFKEVEFATTIHGEERVAKFRLDGFVDVYKPVADACNSTPPAGISVPTYIPIPTVVPTLALPTRPAVSAPDRNTTSGFCSMENFARINARQVSALQREDLAAASAANIEMGRWVDRCQ